MSSDALTFGAMTGRALPKQSFCLIRHGETTANRDGIIAGRTEVALTEAGRAQALALRHLAWPSDLALFTSPMGRAVETAALGFPGHMRQSHPGLRERDWGALEGRPLAQLPERSLTPAGGEAWLDMVDRVAEAIADCCAASASALPVLVCHSGVIRATRLLCGQTSTGARAPNAQPLIFHPGPNGHKEHSYDREHPQTLRGF